MSDEFFDADEVVVAHRPGSHYQPSPRLAVALLVAFIISLVAVFHYVNPISVNGHAVTTTTPSTTTTLANSSTTTIPRGQVKVQVANGTTIGGLARTYTAQLQTNSWGVLQQINGPRVNSTTIYYRLKFQWAARAIASELHVSQAAVRRLEHFSGVPGYNIDDVIVIIGPDLAHG
jgi:hypothetical protein